VFNLYWSTTLPVVNRQFGLMSRLGARDRLLTKISKQGESSTRHMYSSRTSVLVTCARLFHTRGPKYFGSIETLSRFHAAGSEIVTPISRSDSSLSVMLFSQVATVRPRCVCRHPTTLCADHCDDVCCAQMLRNLHARRRRRCRRRRCRRRRRRRECVKPSGPKERDRLLE